MTNAKGRTVDFRNTVVIMTSNLGSQYLLQGATAHDEIMLANDVLDSEDPDEPAEEPA
jgi:ATP-dependent Clp protease ATP-binding subunit ClpA